MIRALGDVLKKEFWREEKGEGCKETHKCPESLTINLLSIGLEKKEMENCFLCDVATKFLNAVQSLETGWIAQEINMTLHADLLDMVKERAKESNAVCGFLGGSA